jgi:hypothetical protein
LETHNFTIMKTLSIFSLAIIFSLFSMQVSAQSARLKVANRAFESYGYAEAVRGYEEFLRTDRKGDQAEKKEALEKLAYCYRRLQDSRNAERVYSELVQGFSDIDSRNVMYYAQALASNGKVRESQKMYSKYAELQTADLRGRKFAVAYMDMNRFYKDSASYRVDYLSINSRQADFSPMYYKGGLVFVSGRDESGIVKRVFSWNNTPFLDLYFAPDTNAFKGVRDSYNRGGGAQLGAASKVENSLSEATAADDAEDSQMPMTKSQKFSKTLNTKYHEGPASFFKDYTKVVFTRNNYNTGKSRKSAKKAKIGVT